MLNEENNEFIFEDNINNENKIDEILQINNDNNNILKNDNNDNIFENKIFDKKLKKCKYNDNDFNDIYDLKELIQEEIIEKKRNKKFNKKNK